MTKLALVSLAALATALPAAANAQPAPRPGHSWDEPRQRTVVRHDRRRMAEPGRHQRRFGHVRRIERGHMVPAFWSGPQFQVPHWQMYGFPQPMPGHRWIRYYDDALLVDRRGRVRDGRYGVDWDRYGDRWGYDERGIPVYVGDGDYHPRERDYAWVEEHGPGYDSGWDYSEYGAVAPAGYGSCAPAHPAPCGPPAHGGCVPAPRSPCGPAVRYGPAPGYGAPPGYGYPAPAYGYGYQGYGHQGYGYGCCGTVTITETTVTTGGASSSYYEEIVEEEEVVSRPRVRRVHRRPVRRPIRGERG